MEIIKDEDGGVFVGIINKTDNMKGSYLSFAASLSSEEVATFSIRDRNIVFVNNEDVPWDELKAEAKVFNNNPLYRRFWVQGALLASLDVSRYSKIESDASGVVGPTFGVENKVYNKGQEEIHDYKISLYLIDLDKLSQFLANPSFNETSFLDPNILQDLSPGIVEILKIKDSDIK